MKLGIGTVQFGMHYGVSNQEGKTPVDEARAIVNFALDKGIEVIDTAPGYGESEKVLGTVLPLLHRFRIITKTPGFKEGPSGSAKKDVLKRAFGRSLETLRQSAVAGLLVHSVDDLLAPEGAVIFEALQELKRAGIVDKIGVSIYTGEQIDRILDRYPVDLVQLPINLLDTRLLTSGHLAALKQHSIEIHARSIFLQGLLLMDPERLPPFFEPVKPLLLRYHEFLRSNGLTPVEGAFCFITGLSEIDCVIIGVNRLSQLLVNYEAFHRTYDKELRDQLRSFSLDDPRFVNPALWKIHEA